MNQFNKEIFDREFSTRNIETEKNQAKELRALVDKHSRDNTIRSSIFLDSHRELKEKYFKEYLKIIIDSIFLSFPAKSKIGNSDRKIIEEILNKKSISYIESEKNGLRSAMLSYGHQNNSIIITETIKSLESSLNRVKKYSQDILFIKTEKHKVDDSLTEVLSDKIEEDVADKTDWLELKPNIFGIGINFNKIIKDLRSILKRKIKS